MQKTMDATSETLQLVFDLLQMTSPEIWSRFQALNFEPFFTLSWFLTWFTHILSDSNDIHRLYDLFMASDSSMLIYLSVSVNDLIVLTHLSRANSVASAWGFVEWVFICVWMSIRHITVAANTSWNLIYYVLRKVNHSFCDTLDFGN